MIAWTIEAAITSGCFDRVVVSTDDEEIAEVSRQFGAMVPFIRPAELADDHTGTAAVVAHAIEWQIAAGDDPSAVCCLYATAPMLKIDDIQRGLAMLQSSNCSYAFSVTNYPFPIQRAFRIGAEGRVQMFDPTQFAVRSQDLEEAYHDAGQFYWGRPSAWLNQIPIFSPDSIPVVLPMHRVVDIDTPEDWERARLAFEIVRRMEG